MPTTVSSCLATASFLLLGGGVTAKSGDVLWTFHYGPGSSGPSAAGQVSCETYYGIDNAGPVVANGDVYFMSEQAGWEVMAVDAKTGKQKWTTATTTTTGNKAASAVAISEKGDTLYYIRDTGKLELVALEATTGKESWSAAVPGKNVYGPPAASNGTLFVNLDSGLFAFRADNGKQVWSAEKDTGCTETTPQVHDGKVYTTGGMGHNGVLVLDAKTGSKVWDALPKVDNPWASPVVAASSNMVLAGGFEGKGSTSYYTGLVYGLKEATGEEAWHFNLTAVDSTSYAPLAPAVADRKLFVAGATPRVFAIDVATGKQEWVTDEICQGHFWMVPAVDSGTVYAGCDGGSMFALDAATGAKKWQVSTGDAARSPVVSDGTVFFGVNTLRAAGTAEKLMAVEA